MGKNQLWDLRCVGGRSKCDEPPVAMLEIDYEGYYPVCQKHADEDAQDTFWTEDRRKKP